MLLVRIPFGAISVHRCAEFAGKRASSLCNATFKMSAELRMKLFERASSAGFEIAQKLCRSLFEFLRAVLHSGSASLAKKIDFLVGNSPHDLSKRPGRRLRRSLEASFCPFSDLVAESFYVLAHLRDTIIRLLTQPSFELLTRVRHFFIHPGIGARERLFDKHLQSRSRFLLKPL